MLTFTSEDLSRGASNYTETSAATLTRRGAAGMPLSQIARELLSTPMRSSSFLSKIKLEEIKGMRMCIYILRYMYIYVCRHADKNLKNICRKANTTHS